MAGVDPYRCLELEAVPWRRFGGRRVIAVANPAQGPEAMRALGKEGERMALAIARPDAIRRAVASHFGAQMVERAEERCADALQLPLDAQQPADLAQGARCSQAGWPRWRSRPGWRCRLALAWILLANLLTMGLRLVAIFTRIRSGRASHLRDPAARRLPAPAAGVDHRAAQGRGGGGGPAAGGAGEDGVSRSPSRHQAGARGGRPRHPPRPSSTPGCRRRSRSSPFRPAASRPSPAP